MHVTRSLAEFLAKGVEVAQIILAQTSRIDRLQVGGVLQVAKLGLLAEGKLNLIRGKHMKEDDFVMTMP